ncbi:hypothetical protein BJV82DRAFT_581350 [Fennellomyces sp. T-0311]|nr:hypothetical protein BJV82DRAFT_581350 [Fennellomyces sp. T-0311]
MQLRKIFSGLPYIMGAFVLTASALPIKQRSTVDLGIAQVGADVKTGTPVDDILAALPEKISVPELLEKLPKLCVADVTGKLPEVPVVSDVVGLLPDICLDDLTKTLHLEKRGVDLGLIKVDADVKTGIPPVDDIIAGLPDISVPELLKKLPNLCVSDVTGKLPELPVVSDVVKALPDICLDKLLQKVPLENKALDKRHGKELAPSDAADISAKAIAEIQAILKAKISAKVAASLEQSLEASLSVKLDILGGLVKIGNAEISAVQRAALKNLKAKIEAKIDAALKSKIFVGAEADLTAALETVTGLLPSGLLPEEKLLPIVADIVADIKADLKLELPEIMADLSADIAAEVDVEIKDLSVTVPLIISIEINADIDFDLEINAAVKVALSALAKLDVDAAARVVVKELI